MGIYNTIDQTQPVVLTHVSPSLAPLLTGRIASVAAHGQSKTHKSTTDKGADEYVGLEEDDVCFEVNALYRTLSPLHTNTRNVGGGIFNYAIVIGAHDLLGTDELQCAESDGLHVFRADGKAIDIDLNQVPFKLLIHQQDRHAFELLLEHQSCWAESIAKMQEPEKRAFFDNMIHAVPGYTKDNAGLQTEGATTYLRKPAVLKALVPHSPPGLPLSVRSGHKEMKTFTAKRYGMDNALAQRRELVSGVAPLDQRLRGDGGYYRQLLNVARMAVVQAKIEDRVLRTGDPVFKGYAQQVQQEQQRLNEKLVDISKSTRAPYGTRSIPHGLSMVINQHIGDMFPETYIEPPSTAGLTGTEATAVRASYEQELQRRRYEMNIAEPHTLRIRDLPLLSTAPGLTLAHASDYSTESGCEVLWSHLYWNVAMAPSPPPLPDSASVQTLEDLLGPVGKDVHNMLAVQAASQPVDLVENVLGAIDDDTRSLVVNSNIRGDLRNAPEFDDAGSFSM